MNVDSRLKQALQERMPLGLLAYEEVSGQTVDLLTEYFMLLGFKIPDMQELTLLARKVTDDLYESYSFLRMEEVAICFELGAKGDFGEYVGLNWRTVTRWLKSYKTCDRRLKVKQELEEMARQKDTPELDPEQERMHETHFLLTVFHYYKTRAMGDNVNFPIKTYEALEQRGVLPYTEQEKQETIARFESQVQKRRSNGLRIRDCWMSTDALSQACEFLLKKYFNSIDTLELD